MTSTEIHSDHRCRNGSSRGFACAFACAARDEEEMINSCRLHSLHYTYHGDLGGLHDVGQCGGYNGQITWLQLDHVRTLAFADKQPVDILSSSASSSSRRGHLQCSAILFAVYGHQIGPKEITQSKLVGSTLAEHANPTGVSRVGIIAITQRGAVHAPQILALVRRLRLLLLRQLLIHILGTVSVLNADTPIGLDKYEW